MSGFHGCGKGFGSRGQRKAKIYFYDGSVSEFSGAHVISVTHGARITNGPMQLSEPCRENVGVISTLKEDAFIWFEVYATQLRDCLQVCGFNFQFFYEIARDIVSESSNLEFETVSAMPTASRHQRQRLKLEVSYPISGPLINTNIVNPAL